MVLIRFVGFILAVILVSFALQSGFVHGVHHQDTRILESVEETQDNDASLKKKYVAETLAFGSGSKEERIGGRKMGMILKEDGEETAGSTSSTDSDAKKGPQDNLNNQELLSRSISSTSSFSTNKLYPGDHESDEWKKLLEKADKKVMQMLRRDYGGMKRPRRKPPINNHEPRN